MTFQMSTLNTGLPILLSLLGWSFYRALTSRWSRSRLPLPPSPPADPLLGHARTLLSAYGREDVFFHELGLKYGGIVHLNAMGQNVVVLNDATIAEALLDKRGSIYSSRLRVPLGEIMGLKQALPFLPYGNDFRLHRKLFAKYFHQERCVEHQPIESREARILIQNIAKSPEDWEAHLLRYATAIIIEIAFGHTTSTSNDPYIKIADDVRNHVVPCLMNSDPVASGLALMFPFLQYMPSWFPGSHYPRMARKAKTYIDAFYNYPLKNVQAEMAAGTAKPSFLSEQLQELQDAEVTPGITLTHIQGAATMSYLGGTETTSSTLATLIAAMLLYPEHQENIQAEIDAVVGSDRLPTFADRSSLPSLDRVLQEVERWQPAIPIAPHYLTEDDTYHGMFIPRGTLVVGNIRGMNMDEATYMEPLTFNPDRYLPKPKGYGEPYPASTWGFGRRVCPGRYLAEDCLWIAAAHLLATMSIKKARSRDGRPIEPDVRFIYGGSTSHPLPFRCRIEPRNEAVCKLIHSSEVL